MNYYKPWKWLFLIHQIKIAMMLGILGKLMKAIKPLSLLLRSRPMRNDRIYNWLHSKPLYKPRSKTEIITEILSGLFVAVAIVATVMLTLVQLGG